MKKSYPDPHVLAAIARKHGLSPEHVGVDHGTRLAIDIRTGQPLTREGFMGNNVTTTVRRPR